jgi:hypothetical protein
MSTGAHTCPDGTRPRDPWRRIRRAGRRNDVTLTKKSCVAVLSVAAALMLAAAPSASAFTHDVGTVGVGELTPMSLGGLTSCDAMNFTGHVTSNDRTYGTLGGTFQIDKASFENCTAGAKVTASLPLSFSVDPAGGTGVGLDLDIATASGTCRYSGTLWGGGGAGGSNVGGDLYRRTEGCGGPSQFALRSNLYYTDTEGGTL